jgi:hypothetical protein
MLERHVERRARPLDAVLQVSGGRGTGADVRDDASSGTAQSYLATTDPIVVQFETWVRDNLERDISIPDAAHAGGTTRRTLERRIRAHLGVTRTRWFSGYGSSGHVVCGEPRHCRWTGSPP